MKHSLTRLAVALTALYWISGIVLAITSAALEPQSGWLVFAWYQLTEIILLYYVVPLTALLWIGWAIFWLCGGATWATPFKQRTRNGAGNVVQLMRRDPLSAR